MWIRTWSVCLSCFLWSWKNNMVRNFKRGLPTQILQIGFHCFYIFRFSNLNSHLVFRRSILNDSRFLTLHVRFSTIGSQLLVCNARLWNVSFVTCLFSVSLLRILGLKLSMLQFRFPACRFFRFGVHISDVGCSVINIHNANSFLTFLKICQSCVETNLKETYDV